MNHTSIRVAPFYKTTLRPPRSLQLCLSTGRSSTTARNLCAHLPAWSIASDFNAHHRSSPYQLLLSRCSLRTLTCPNNDFSSTLANPNNARWISHSYSLRKAADTQPPPSPENYAGAITVTNHQPPLPVRIALVSTTTALATPSFPALGFLYVVLRYTVPDASLRKTMEGRWGTLLSFTTWTLLPQLYHGTVASLVLPCAVGNAIVAGGVYGLVDLACGGPSSSSATVNRALQTPFVTGSGIGATVGYVAPHYVYGPVVENLYAMEGASQSLQTIMSFPGTTSASVATGAIAGMLLHPLLYYPMNGIAGVHWGYFSGTVLAAVTSALLYVYYGREDTGLPIPYGSFIEPSKMQIVDSIMRYNNVTGAVETYSLSKGKFIGSPDMCLEGRKIANASRSYAKSGKVVFDDRLLAFVYNFWDENTKTKYPRHILNIKTKKELQQKQDSTALTDASVAVILHDEKYGTGQHADSSGACISSSDDVMKILTTINDLSSSAKERKQLSFKSLEEVSVAIQLLMIMKQSEQYRPKIEEVPTLESVISRRCPDLTLYSSDEQYEGESVESQLRIANWKGPELSQATHRWKMVQGNEVHRTWRNRACVIAAGVILSVAGSMLRGSIYRLAKSPK